MKKIAILIFFSLFSQVAYAFEENNLNACLVSEEIFNNYEPEKFSTGNNLLRKAGTHEVYCGQKILLQINLKDKECIPISDAKIYIWQVGCDGKYPYEPLRNRVKKELINTKSKSSFVGSGIATSDNLGNARFITIYPPARHKQNFINVRVKHSQYGEFQTQIKMSKDMIHQTDKYDIVDYSITLPWNNIRRRF